ncbi:MAG: hypothetical protein COV67_03935 [Nitrospinae bacterium CG11_big_fil_rev_8_21_14_0_20_56_8]|nr:MAG: hypothetical protein COV67_03935 [Nitrospinae bacterium CG11_big_fil_rev_8_21_14_0_20_56_8]
MDPLERFKDNPSGIITDTLNNRHWLPKDSKQDLGRWQSWHDISGYVRIMNQVYAGGHNDWRLPTLEEAQSLYGEAYVHTDFEGQEIHIHSAFVRGCAYLMWTSDVNESGQTARLNLREGVVDYVDKDTSDLMAARLVRKIRE